jgi:phosphoserine phosphatase RsbU/P
MFVTALIGYVELASGMVSLVDAGHTPPLVLDAAGDVARLTPAKGMALGVLDQQTYAVSMARRRRSPAALQRMA